MDFCGEAGGYFGDLLFYVRYDRKRVVTVAGDHCASYRFCAFLVEGSASQSWAVRDGCDVFYKNGNVVCYFYDALLDVGDLLYETY